MTILIFIIILLVLVIIHEAGHFFAAKGSGVRVDEFAFGFPPRLFSVKKGETTYAFNLLPIGGYVKIHGENGEDKNNQDGSEKIKDKRNFANKHPIIKIFILAAGVIMNLILAYILITASTYISTSFLVDKNSTEYQTLLKENRIHNERVVIVGVVKNSPAEMAGLKSGYEIDKIYFNEENPKGEVNSKKSLNLSKNENEIINNISEILNSNNKYNDSITFVYKNRKGDTASTTIAGVYNLEGVKDKKMIGVSIGKIANVKLKFFEALKLGYGKTIEYTKLTVIGFKDLFVKLFTTGSLSEGVAGPVGMVKEVGNVRELGFNYLLLFTAVLSISLAVFNILPFPALDGGRILFVLIEWISGRKISEKWQNILNGAGFLLLILLMIFVTVKDVMKLF